MDMNGKSEREREKEVHDPHVGCAARVAGARKLARDWISILRALQSRVETSRGGT